MKERESGFSLPLAHTGRQAQPSTKEEEEEIRFLLFPLIRATQPPVLTYLLLPPPPSPAQARGENPANTHTIAAIGRHGGLGEAETVSRILFPSFRFS